MSFMHDNLYAYLSSAYPKGHVYTGFMLHMSILHAPEANSRWAEKPIARERETRCANVSANRYESIRNSSQKAKHRRGTHHSRSYVPVTEANIT